MTQPRTRCFEVLLLLPRSIDFAGFRFTLQATRHPKIGPGIGYIVTECLSKNPEKRRVFAQTRTWYDRNQSSPISSMGTDHLFFVATWGISDADLQSACKDLLNQLLLNRILSPAAPVTSEPVKIY